MAWLVSSGCLEKSEKDIREAISGCCVALCGFRCAISPHAIGRARGARLPQPARGQVLGEEHKQGEPWSPAQHPGAEGSAAGCLTCPPQRQAGVPARCVQTQLCDTARSPPVTMYAHFLTCRYFSIPSISSHSREFQSSGSFSKK